MSWYDEPWTRRKCITVVNAGGAATGDVDVAIPADWDAFWDVIDAAGAELRVTQADGYTLLNYDVDDGAGGAFDSAAREGRIRIDGAALSATADTISLFWVYFESRTAQGDASVAVTMTSIITGYIDLGSPFPPWRMILAEPQPPGITRPQSLGAKSSGATDHFWIDLASFLERRDGTFAGMDEFEEISVVLLAAYTTAGASAPTLFTAADLRFVETRRGSRRRMWLRVPVTAGTDANNYTIRALIDTRIPNRSTTHRRHDQRFGLRVVDALEAAT